MLDNLNKDDSLQLFSESDNVHEQQALKVIYGNKKFGYIPGKDNTTVSQMLKRNQKLIARIAVLQQSRDPWKRITIDILLVAG